MHSVEAVGLSLPTLSAKRHRREVQRVRATKTATLVANWLRSQLYFTVRLSKVFKRWISTMSGSVARAPAVRSLLKEKAYTEIKERIQDATFAAGTFLSERQLATLLGMSKTPIKAALERLEQEGFVAVSPQQGIVVRELTLKEVVDQFELRKALESYVVNSIAGKLDASQLSGFDRNLRRQNTAANKGAVSKLVELDAEFHLLLCEAFGNDAIVDCLMQHRSKMHRVIFQVAQAPGRLPDSVEEHERIFAAIRNGEAAEAVRLLTQHLEFGKQYLMSPKYTH